MSEPPPGTGSSPAEVEGRWRNLVEHGTELIAVVDAEGVFRWLSPAARAVLGREPDELLGVAASSLVHPDDRPDALAQLGRVVAGSTTGLRAARLRLCRPDGTVRHVEVLATNLVDDPAVGGIVVNAWDVTERHLAEEALRSSEGWWRALVQNTSDVMIVYDRDQRITYVSPSVTRILGWDPAELVGLGAGELVHPDDRARMQQRLSERVQGERRGPESHVYRVRAKHGDWCSLETMSSNRLDDPHVRGIVVNARDVTDRARAEEALLESDRRHRALVANISDLVLVTDAQGVITYASPSVATVLGWRPNVVLGRSLFDGVHADDVDVARARLAAAVREAGVTGPHRFRHKRADGEWRHLEAVANNRVDDPAVGGVVLALRDVTDHVAAEEGLRQLAMHDPLTGLPNRSLLADRLRLALATGRRTGQATGVVVLDLDHFKDVNDSLGHEAGDAVLVELGARLQGLLRETDTLGRLGGDEFAVVLAGVAGVGEATDAARRLLDELRRPVQLDVMEVRVGGSLGLAVAPDHGDDPDDLVRLADAAMYRAKEQRLGLAVCHRDDLAEGRERLQLAAELHRAVEGDELVLHYQPIVDLAAGRVVAAEALVRWRHPDRGLVAPGDFVTVSEQLGLIRPISRWVLRTALEECRRWLDAGHDVSVSVNLAAGMLHDPELVDMVRSHLHAAGVPSTRLDLEVTEQVVMQNPEVSVEAMVELSELGIGFSVDDFGSGYSSLTYLRLLPVRAVKIDRAFVSSLLPDSTDESVVHSVIDIAHHLGMVAVAEGVETADTLELLRRLGCDRAQGHHLGRPQPGSELSALLELQPARQV